MSALSQISAAIPQVVLLTQRHAPPQFVKEVFEHHDFVLRLWRFGGYHCGYVDPGGRFAVPAVFRIVKPFFEGRAAVLLEGSGWGVIDSRGGYVVQPTFAYVGAFSEGLAAACPDEKNLYRWVYIDRSGKIAIELKYNVTHAFPFHDGKAWVGSPFLFSSESRLVDRTGRTLITIRKWH